MSDEDDINKENEETNDENEETNDENDTLSQNIKEWCQGDPEALARLFENIFPDLHLLARQSLRAHRGTTLGPTALVNELYLKISKPKPDHLHFANRKSFFGYLRKAYHHLLLDRHRAKKSLKRGGNHERTTFQDDAGARSRSLTLERDLVDLLKKLHRIAPLRARLVLRRAAGETWDEIVEAEGFSRAKLCKEHRSAILWLRFQANAQKKDTMKRDTTKRDTTSYTSGGHAATG